MTWRERVTIILIAFVGGTIGCLIGSAAMNLLGMVR
jgi:hypothetical protein